jgi:hypothetical protein
VPCGCWWRWCPWAQNWALQLWSLPIVWVTNWQLRSSNVCMELWNSGVAHSEKNVFINGYMTCFISRPISTIRLYGCNLLAYTR